MNRSTAIGLAAGGAALVGLYFLWGRDYLKAQKGKAASMRQQAKSIAASVPKVPIAVRTSAGTATLDRSGADGAAKVKAQADAGKINPVGFNADRWYGVAG